MSSTNSIETQYDDTFVDEALSQSVTTTNALSSDESFGTHPFSTDFEDDALENFIQKSVKQLLTARNNAKHDKKKKELTLEKNGKQLESFCDEKIAKLKAQLDSGSHKTGTDRPATGASASQQERIHHVPWVYQMQKLRIENFNRHLERVRKQTPIPSSRKPSNESSEMKSREFLRRKTNILTNAAIEQKYNDQITQKTSAVLIADIIRDSLNPLATKEEIWNKLMQPLTSTKERKTMQAQLETLG